MKRSLIFLFLIFITFFLHAQEKPSFISINAGTSIPVGGFSSKELPDGGFAQAGLSVTVDGAWFIKSWLGIGGNTGLSLNPVDVVTLGYEKALSDPFIDEAFIRSDPYAVTSLYAGLYFHIPVMQRFSVTAKALGGMIYARTPYQLYKADYYMIGYQWFEVTSSGDYEASFLAGAGFRYDLKNCLGLTLNSDFTYNQCDFDFTTPDGSTRTDQKVISIVNVSLGLVIRL
jgi:hypothetical protein